MSNNEFLYKLIIFMSIIISAHSEYNKVHNKSGQTKTSMACEACVRDGVRCVSLRAHSGRALNVCAQHENKHLTHKHIYMSTQATVQVMRFVCFAVFCFLLWSEPHNIQT